MLLIDSNWQQRYLLLHPGDDELTTINGTMMQWEEAEYTGVPRTPSRPDHDVYVYDESDNTFYYWGPDDDTRSGSTVFVELPHSITGGAEVYNPTFHDAIRGIVANARKTDNSIYNINGQRINRLTQKGVYIINGNKVLVN